MPTTSKQQDINKEDEYIETDILINLYFKKILKSKEKRNKYLDLLNQRIDENKKSLNRLLLIVLFLIIAFPLILQTKIDEISVGPFKLQENTIALYIIPSVFAFCHYKIIQVYLVISSQSKYYMGLTSVIFKHRQFSVANNIIKPYLFLESTAYYHLTEESKSLKKILNFFWYSMLLGIILFPYWFIYYTLKSLFIKYGLNSIQDLMFFLSPIFISCFTFVLTVQHFKRKNITEEENEKE
ncbi:hypothetical protein [Flavobacterium sp. 22076]|uniref:hypothetical protein n=1 Tax=unclassified Flavobacterium TaxID=196869 RepID=UPI003F8315DB